MAFAEDYNTVPQRIAEFREKHPEGCLQPVDPANPFQVLEVGGKTFIVYAAAAYRTPDDPRPGIGLAYEPFPGPTNFTKDSELQNAETSAWGRAIVACLAADAKKGIATAEDIRNRTASPEPEPNPKADPLVDRVMALPEEAQNKILAWFGVPVGEWKFLADEHLDKLAEVVTKAEQKVEASTAPSGAQGGEGASNPPEEPPAPPVASAEDNDTPRPSAEAAAVTKPAKNSPAARIREGLKDGTLKDQPALGAVKRDEPSGIGGLQDAFPGAELEAS